MLLLNQLIERRKVTARKEKPDSASLGFGKYFTDYMFVMDYEEERGWHDPRITLMNRSIWILPHRFSITGRPYLKG